MGNPNLGVNVSELLVRAKDLTMEMVKKHNMAPTPELARMSAVFISALLGQALRSGVGPQEASYPLSWGCKLYGVPFTDKTMAYFQELGARIIHDLPGCTFREARVGPASSHDDA